MKVHLIKEKTIRKYVSENAASIASFQDWIMKLKNADWETPADVAFTFRSSDLLGKGSSRVVFDIGGNNYRLICKYAFGENEVHLFVCWIGTHVAYDKLCRNREQFTVNDY